MQLKQMHYFSYINFILHPTLIPKLMARSCNSVTHIHVWITLDKLVYSLLMNPK